MKDVIKTVKITTLARALNKIAKEFGDMPVVISDGDDFITENDRFIGLKPNYITIQNINGKNIIVFGEWKEWKNENRFRD